MRKVIWIDSMCHYLIQEQGKHLVLFEFPDYCCSMYDYKVNMDDAIKVTRWKKGRKVLIKFISECLHEWADSNTCCYGKLSETDITCGDDMKYLTR